MQVALNLKKMKANELRIGNLVKVINKETNDNETWIVSKISSVGDRISITKGVHQINGVIRYYQIPLTEEWLVKFGFDEIKYNGCDIWKLKDQSTGKHISFVFYNEELYTSFDTEPAFEPIKYVHQLQNLYFALTGEELTIKTN